MTKLNKDVKTFTEQLFKKRSDKGFDELKVKYNNLLKKMEAYKKENDEYSDYEERCRLMGEAINDMKQTMGYLNKHRDNLEAVNEYLAYSKAAKEMAETSAEKQIDSFDYLNKRIHEEEVHRQQNAEKVLNNDVQIKKEAGRDLTKSCFNALYMQVVKDEYGPKPNETPEQKAQRDDTLLKAIDRGEKGTVADMKKIVESEFGKKYIANCKKMMIAGKQFSQEKLMECRDTAIAQCYDEYVEKFKSAKNRRDLNAGKENRDDLINLSRMSKALGSKALDGKKLPALKNDSKVKEFNLKIDNKPSPKKSM